MKLPTNELLNLDAIRTTRKGVPSAISGIYFLFSGDRLVYIGQSVDVERRVINHAEALTFDSYGLIECPPEHLDELEAAYILRFKPPENGHDGRNLGRRYPPGLALFSPTSGDTAGMGFCYDSARWCRAKVA